MTISKYQNAAGQILTIRQDPEPQNPIEFFDTLGLLLCCHGRYSLGHENFKTPNELNARMEELKPVVKMPLYLLDHSGLSINTTGFNDPWDSGQIGYIITTKDRIKNIMGEKYLKTKLGPNTKNQLRKILNDEVKTFDDYLTGCVYEYEITHRKTCNLGHEHAEFLDQCSGFYGDPHDLNTFGLNSKEWREI